MLPVNLLGDAAAAEEMVKQCTRTGRADQTARNDIFIRCLQRSMEEHLLTSIRPASGVIEYNPIIPGNETPPKRERHNRPNRKPFQAFRDQPEPTPRYIQPLLFDMHIDRVSQEYQQTDRDIDLGRIVDRTV